METDITTRIRLSGVTEDDIQEHTPYLVQELSGSILEIADELVAKKTISKETWNEIGSAEKTNQSKVRLVLRSLFTDDENKRKIVDFLDAVSITNKYLVEEILQKKSHNNCSQSVATCDSGEPTEVKLASGDHSEEIDENHETGPKRVCLRTPQQPVENSCSFRTANDDNHAAMEEETLRLKTPRLSTSSLDTDTPRKCIVTDANQNNNSERSYDENSWPGSSSSCRAPSTLLLSQLQVATTPLTPICMNADIPRPVQRRSQSFEGDAIELRRFCKLAEKLQDDFAWGKCDEFMQKLRANKNNLPFLNSVQCKVALLALEIRKQCYQKRIKRRTITRDFTGMLEELKHCPDASFLQAKLFTMKAWASWLIGKDDDADDCFEGAEQNTSLMASGEETGLYHYQMGFFLRYKYMKMSKSEKKQMPGVADEYFKNIMTHYNESVKAFEEANKQFEGNCSSLLIYAHLSLVQALLKTGVTTGYKSWDQRSISESNKNTAERHLEKIYNDLWNDVQSFPHLCYYTAKCDLHFLRGHYKKATESLQEAQRCLREHDNFGIPSIGASLEERENTLSLKISEERDLEKNKLWSAI